MPPTGSTSSSLPSRTFDKKAKYCKDKFIDEVGTDPKLITEELIDNFLENQGINRYTGRLAEILKKNKEVEDNIAKAEEYHKAVKKIMKLKKESKR